MMPKSERRFFTLLSKKAEQAGDRVPPELLDKYKKVSQQPEKPPENREVSG